MTGIHANIARLTIMTAAQEVAFADRQFTDLAKPSTTLSERLRYNKILADAAYVYSLLSTNTGNYKDAAKHARQCVMLNRRIWAALESRANAKKSPLVDEGGSDSQILDKAAFDPLSSMRNDKGAPLVMSVTHDALNGAEFWSLVPALYRGLMQHSQIFAHQGFLHEAIYVAEQAEKIASATKSRTLVTDNASWRADCWAQSGRPDKAQPILDSLKLDKNRTCLSIVGYQSAIARVHHWNGEYRSEVASYGTLSQLLQELTSPTYIKTLDTFSHDIDNLSQKMSQVKIDASKAPIVKAATTRGRKPATKPAKGPAPKPVAKPAPKARSRVNATIEAIAAPNANVRSGTTRSLEVTSSVEQCSVLHGFHTELIHRQVLASISQEDLVTASTLLAEMEQREGSMAQDLSHSWATVKMMLAQSARQIAENIAINTLPESTIAFPAINLNEQTLSHELAPKRSALTSLTTAKVSRAKKAMKEDFTETLINARDRLVEAHTACGTNGPNHKFQQISMALGTITVLLSAVSKAELGGSLHPVYAAYMGGSLPSNLRLII
jgi:separase